MLSVLSCLDHRRTKENQRLEKPDPMGFPGGGTARRAHNSPRLRRTVAQTVPLGHSHAHVPPPEPICGHAFMPFYLYPPTFNDSGLSRYRGEDTFFTVGAETRLRISKEVN